LQNLPPVWPGPEWGQSPGVREQLQCPAMQLSALVLTLALAAAQAAPGPMRARLSPLPTDLAMQ